VQISKFLLVSILDFLGGNKKECKIIGGI
jgi:hypothetical protein